MITKAELYDAVDRREGELVAFLRDFLAIETENPPGRNYREAADFLTAAMDRRGYRVEQVQVPSEVVERHYPDRTEYERVNVVGRRPADAETDGRTAGNGPRGDAGDGPHVHFTGHFDVVPAGEDWSTDPYDPVVEDGRVYARGASDMKSGIAASLFAVDALDSLDTPLPGTITQSMTVDEETGGFTGLGFLVEEGHVSLENTDYCVYTECFGSSRICLGHRGVLKFRVTATGEKAHGCMAHDGRNAITAMNDFLTRIEAYRQRLHDRTTDQPVTPVESRRADVSATMLDAGYSENVVPDRCRATFYRVLVPDETVDDARDEIGALIEETEEAVDTELSYDEIMYAEPTVVSEERTVARTYAKHVQDFHGQPEFVVSPGSDDQRFVVNDAGIEECIVYGPGQLDQAHVVDEYVPIEEVLTAAKVMAVSTADLMGVLET
jgi:succinyl-diaminopimelate desuccinylase